MGAAVTASRAGFVEMTPQAIDTKLADLYEAIQRAAHHADWIRMEIARVQRRGTTTAFLEQELSKADAKVEALQEAIEPLDREYRLRQWKRYFLVTNGNGHVHRGRECTTCYPSTRYGWLPALSGCEERVMVAEYGEKACTVCFPEAPSLYAAMKAAGILPQREAEAAARKAERAAKRAAIAAKQAANAITNPDGTRILITGHRIPNTILTVTEAKRELKAIIAGLAYGQPGSWYDSERVNLTADVERLVAALAAKTGETATAIRAKAEKMARKEWGR